MRRQTPLLRRLAFAGSIILTAIVWASFASAQQCTGKFWSIHVEDRMVEGLSLMQSFYAGDRVKIWRLLALGESSPVYRQDDPLQSTEDRYADAEAWFAAASALGLDKSFEPRAWKFSNQVNYAFALSLLKEREALLGPTHPYIKKWLANQFIALGNARSWDGGIHLPDRNGTVFYIAPGALGPDDLRYQTAAAIFYAGKSGEAALRFETIAKDPTSRFWKIAAYMAARSWALTGNGPATQEAIDRILTDPLLVDFRVDARGLLRFASAMQGVKSDMDFLSMPDHALEEDPQLRHAYLQAIVNLRYDLRSDRSRDWAAERIDEDWWLAGIGPVGGLIFGLPYDAAEAELIDWLQTMESATEMAAGPWVDYEGFRATSAAFRHVGKNAMRRWEADKSLPWAIAVAIHAEPETPAEETVRHIYNGLKSRVDNCLASDAELIAFGPISFHYHRLLAMQTYFRYWGPRQILDGYRQDWSKGYWDHATVGALTETARYLIAHGQMETAKYMMTHIPPAEAAFGRFLTTNLTDYVRKLKGQVRDLDMQAYINLLPVRSLITLAQSDALEPEDRAAVARMAWTRAFLLQQQENLDLLTPMLGKLNLALLPYTDKIRQSSWTDERRSKGLALLLAAPGMGFKLSPSNERLFYEGERYRSQDSKAFTESSVGFFDRGNVNDNNWWCKFDLKEEIATLHLEFYDVPVGLSKRIIPHAWDAAWPFSDTSARYGFSTSQRTVFEAKRSDILRQHPLMALIDWEELGALSKIPTAPEYFSREAIDWAKNASWLEKWWYGDEIAEALHLAVRATHYGCNRDGPHGSYSREAFKILHRDFGDTEAAKQTPYWYN